MSGDINLDFKLHQAQMQVFKDKTRFRILVAGRRFGKTYEAITETCCEALNPKNVDRKPVLLVAPTHPQAKFLYWRPILDKLHPLIRGTNVNEGLITLDNGVVIAIKGADNPETLRGPGWWFVTLDEYASMKPYVWGEIIRPALIDTRGRALFIGTPAGRNHFYDLVCKAKAAPADWAVHEFTTLDNPLLPDGEVDAMRESLSAAEFAQEALASFDTGGGGHFQREHIRYKTEEPRHGAYLMTVDLAGFTGEVKVRASHRNLLDDHVICITKIVPSKDSVNDWWVKDASMGRWGIKECATRIVDALELHKPMAWGMEKGALYNAVMPYIEEEAKRRKLTLMKPEALSHENRVKAERILWALQGRMEHGRITFNKGDWNAKAEDQLLNFPSKLVHDDFPDALAYVEQLARGKVFYDFSEVDDAPYWAPQDRDIGF